ncbi:putative Ig domain-containing protein [Cupriavidus sp. MP-37]|uniref:putative Ig domain-containing protein n=1 Tax=Cupriavidus sp. MP-37 TaxID=2884455 RepID=UPI001D0B062C|nr:putative Ig domain-containing protein [Cupriavidus sp. MP-37]UDM48834.1 autotransporter domain-containing protein [Cupriavidus sp. MP-37]
MLLALWLGLLLGTPAPALAVSCTLSIAATSNQQTVYGFTSADYAACDPNQFSIAYDAGGNGNFGASTNPTPTSQGGTLYIYNGNLPNGQNENGFVYTPRANFIGTDSATFFTSDDGSSWAPNGTVQFNVSAGPPTVTAISPSSGPASGGTAVTVTGTGFVGVTAVRFGASAASFVVNSASSLTATAPAAAAGTVDVTVTTAAGTSATSAADRFTYVAGPPVANSVSATVAYGSAGNPITLNITGGAASSVGVGSAPAHGTAVASGTSITYTPTSSYAGPDSFTYTATNASGTSAPATVTITVASPNLVYAPSSPPPGFVGGAYSQSLAVASGGTGPYTYTLASGALPPGMTLSSAGLLAGTPIAGGTFNFTVRATDSSTGTGPFSATSGPLALVLGGAAMALSPAPGALSAAAGTPFSQAFTASGGTGPYSYSITVNGGIMPSGLTFNSATGVLAGTPGTAGTVSFIIQANDSSTGTGPYSVAGAYTLTIAAPTVALAPATLANPALGIAYSQSVTASGGTAPYTYSLVAGALPPGLTLNSSTGAIAGTTAAGGNYNFTVLATDSLGFTGSRAYSVTIGAPTIVVNPATLPQATVATAYSQALTAASGTAPYTFAVTAGALPAGMSLSAGGVLSGTPSGGGTHNFTVSATDSSTGTGPYTGSRAYTLAVAAPALSLSPASLQAPVAGVAYSQALTAGGGTAPYSFSVAAGSLPAGLSLNPSTGVLSGTPSTAGSHTFTVRVTDSSTGTGAPYSISRVYTLTTGQGMPSAPPVAVTTLSNAPVTIHAAANAANGPFSGVSIVTPPTSGSAVVNGLDIVYTPAPTASGPVTFTYALANSAGTSAPVPVTVTVNAVPVPVAQKQVSTLAGRPVDVDVTEGASGGPFTGAAVVSVVPADAGTATVASAAPKAPAADGKQLAATAYTVNFVPAAAFAGTAVVTYTLSNAVATSAPAVIHVAVAARRDPSTDPDVVGLVNAQIQAARRFATAQIANYNQRLEALHGTGRAPSGNQISVVMPRAQADPERCQAVAGFAARDACLRGTAAAGQRGRPTDTAAGSRAAHGAGDAGNGTGNGTGNGASSPPDLPGGADPGGQAAAADADDARLAFWTAGTVDFGFANAGTQRSGFRFTTGGVTAGADYRFSDQLTLGIGFGYGRDSTDVGSAGTRSTADSFSAALYGSYRPQPSWFIDGVAGYGSLSFDSRRWVGDENAFAYGKRDGHQVFASLSTGYEYRGQAWLISPYGRLSVSDSTLDPFTETGAGFSALRYFGQSVTTVSGTLGLRTEYATATRWGLFLPFARLEYQHDFSGQSAAGLAYADLAGTGPAYTVVNAPYGRDRLQLGLGGKLRTRSLTFGLDYNVMVGMGGLQQGVRLTFAAPF